jgi:hypothetical protein
MWLIVPHVLVVLCVWCCFMARLSPKSASLAVAPPGTPGLERTSTLRQFWSSRKQHSNQWKQHVVADAS